MTDDFCSDKPTYTMLYKWFYSVYSLRFNNERELKYPTLKLFAGKMSFKKGLSWQKLQACYDYLL